MANNQGNAKAWLIFALGAASHYTVMFNRVAAGQMFPQLMAEFNTTGVGVAALSSIYYYTYSIMQVPAGALADTLGPRKLLSSGLLIGGIGWLLFGSAQTLAVASLARLLAGFGLAGIFLGLLKSIQLWFPADKFGTL
ncbi:MAG TPA: MFS transporter, partial [Bacillota bacterium]|nr:MFS transporter [Bacillota bacterium]